MVSVIVDVFTEESAGVPSNVVLVLAGALVEVRVPLQRPSVDWVAKVPLAVSVYDSPFAVFVFTALRKGKDKVDVTGPLGDVPPPPPPPPQPAKEKTKPIPASKYFIIGID
ncbi:MAG: hypothetical protein Q8R67_15190 [Rhodoferax sp.]|nr:hypothetical protein [Rhodoferax sp.]MDP3653019.1 hypothetical protein [Rhodoferax sp.]